MDPSDLPEEAPIPESPSPPAKIYGMRGRLALILWCLILLLAVPTLFQSAELFYPFRHPPLTEIVLDVFVALILFYALIANWNVLCCIYTTVVYIGFINAIGLAYNGLYIVSIVVMIEYKRIPERAKKMVIRFKAAQSIFFFFTLALIFITLETLAVALADIQRTEEEKRIQLEHQKEQENDGYTQIEYETSI